MSGIFARRTAVALLSFCAVSLLPSAGPAMASDVTFIIRNNHPNAVRVELYSQDRSYVWPGKGKDFFLDDGEAREMSLACEEGEQICYGAWVDGDEDTYWGVGSGNTESCDDCCYICEGGQTEEIVLEE